jgi:hypothetical protein
VVTHGALVVLLAFAGVGAGWSIDAFGFWHAAAMVALAAAGVATCVGAAKGTGQRFFAFGATALVATVIWGAAYQCFANDETPRFSPIAVYVKTSNTMYCGAYVTETATTLYLAAPVPETGPTGATGSGPALIAIPAPGQANQLLAAPVNVKPSITVPTGLGLELEHRLGVVALGSTALSGAVSATGPTGTTGPTTC